MDLPDVPRENAEDTSGFLNYMKGHLAEVDLALTIFSTAVFNYKCDSLVKPFPPMYISSSGDKNITALVSKLFPSALHKSMYFQSISGMYAQ